MRVTKEELAKCTNTSQKNSRASEFEYHYFDSKGKPTKESIKGVWAKSITAAKNTNYYVVTNTKGDLLSFDKVHTEANQRLANIEGKDSLNYRKVTKKCFDFYISYLKTKDGNFLDRAEREI